MSKRKINHTPTFTFIPIFIPSIPPPPPKVGKKLTLEERINETKMDNETKLKVLQRYKTMDSDKQKQLEWFEHLLKIPFGTYSPLPIQKNVPQENKKSYFQSIKTHLDTAVYGLDNVKEEIYNYIAQFINTNNINKPRVIGLVGEAGIGKTQIIRNGLGKALNRPMFCISMGGITDSSHFQGFDFTYVGSRHGIIVQALMETKVMNPILFFDEVDKISKTPDG